MTQFHCVTQLFDDFEEIILSQLFSEAKKLVLKAPPDVRYSPKYLGKGCLKAVANVNDIINPALVGMEPRNGNPVPQNRKM